MEAVAPGDPLPVIRQPPPLGPNVTGGLTALGLVAAAYAAIFEPAALSLQMRAFMILWLMTSVVISLTIA